MARVCGRRKPRPGRARELRQPLAGSVPPVGLAPSWLHSTSQGIPSIIQPNNSGSVGNYSCRQWGNLNVVDGVRGARAYLIERAPDAPALEWDVIGSSTKKEASLNSMVSGTKYWFRVAALGTAGQSAYSDPVPLFAP